MPARSRCRFSRRLAGGRDLTREADERHRRHGAVRGGNQAVSVAVRAEGMTAMDTTKRDGDAALVEALRREDPEAPEQLVETYGDRVYRLALRITGSNEDAEEAAQDALWTAARKISTFKGESAFGSWLYRIAANAAYQKLRARRSKAHEIAMDDVLPTFDDDGRHFEPMADWSERVDEQALQGELRRVLGEAIDGLPPDYRTALVLHDVEGLSNPDIAETLGISLPAVKSRIHRSRLFVRKRLAEYMKTA
ncbi:MAG: RNA polymerase subunit sigma [Candidatus Rokuibacteriota bacterium]|nr:MAG: RNA polymerase subunit sigma [Candidatus Rokubacteria bacterium]